MKLRMLRKTGVSTIALIMALSVAFPATAHAATYRDVPATHYAYTAVDWVSNPVNGSFMVGDASNNFNPIRTLDKFETAKILAVAAGYKYSTTSITPAEQEIFDKSYSTYKTLLDSMATQYAKWNKNADREIAYLLYKGIFTSADVGSIVTKANGAETLSNVTKQEAIMYMIRLDGKQSTADAITLPYHTPYKDDALIKADYKKALYYAKEAGIAGGSDGYINPTRAITRAELAQMFYNMLANRPVNPINNTVPTATPNSNATTNATTTVTGVVDSVYLDTHVYISANNIPKIYKLASNAVIIVDNEQKTAAFLIKGMSVTALVNVNSEIVSLVARSAVATETPVTPTAVNLSEDEGYVSAVSTVTGNILTVKAQRVKLSGEIVSEEKVYTLASTCTIKRGNVTVTFSDIKVNDIISFKYMGTVMYEIVLQEKNRTILGTLIEKKYVDLTGTPVLVIEDGKGVKYELRVNSSTYFMRGSTRYITWSDLRIGDDVEAQCEYDQLVAVYATGTRSSVSGTLEEIHITQNGQQILLRKSDKTAATYTLASGTIDVYELRIGMGLKVYLDSWEIYDVAITSYPNSSTTAIVGYIQALRSGNTIVVQENGTNGSSYSITVDSNTTDTATLKALDFNSLRVNMNVYIVLKSSNSSLAKSVTILP